MMKRRDFLHLTALVPVATAIPGAVLTGSPANAAPATKAAQQVPPTLVLVELAGGNDGLNTVIPYADPAYYQLRGGLAIARDQVLPLGPVLGLHPALKPLMPMWAAGRMAVVSGVGYPAPDRSHFRSIEIWETASDSDTYRNDGWLAAAFPKHRAGRLGVNGSPVTSMNGLVLGDQDLGPLHGPSSTGIVMAKPEAFFRLAQRMAGPNKDDATSKRIRSRLAANPALAHILGVQEGIVANAAHLERTLDASQQPSGFDRTPFSRQLVTAARLILGGADLPVIKVTLGGFDTHANQRPKHARLLAQLGSGLAAFCNALKGSPRWASTLVLTYSEFGRRAASNGSGGTDHGTAAPHIVLGGAVRGGHFGAQPRLDRLSAGDMRHTVDFRQVYATVAKQHLRAAGIPQNVAQHTPLGFL